MKKLFIFAALLFGLTAQAQTNVVFKVGSAGYVTIDNQDYKRGYITYRWYLSGSDTLVELAREYNTSQPFRSGRVISKYKDGDNASAAFSSFAAWQTWWRANGAPKPDTVVSGGASSELPAITSVNSIPAVGNGIPIIVAQYKQNGVTSNTTTINYTPTTSGSIFRISWGAYLNNRGVTSITLNFKDQNGNARAIPLSGYSGATPTTTETTFNSSGTFITGNSAEFTVNTGTNITVYVVFQNSPNVDLWFTLTRLF